MATNKIDTLLSQLKTEIDANAALDTGTDVIVELQEITSGDRDTFEDKLAVALDADGVAVAIYIPSFRNEYPNAGGPAVEIQVLVDVWFDPIAKTTARDSITSVIEKLATTLNLFVPAILGRALIITQGDPKVVDSFLVMSLLLEQTLVMDQI